VRFFLGTHHADWLAKTDVPLFVSRRTLHKRKTFPRALGPWSLDSGGFTELSLHGRWTVAPAQYVAEVRRFRDEIGQMAWASPQDWMTEADMLKRTGKTVAEHQRLTVDNYVELRTLAPELPFIPVLQGWCPGDYYECWELYEKAGIDLRAAPVVGIGTVCRRQSTMRVQILMRELAADGLRIHGFGFKRDGLAATHDALASADSAAWSYNARREPPLPGHIARHKNCANCIDWALMWRDELLEKLARGQAQMSLWGAPDNGVAVMGEAVL